MFEKLNTLILSVKNMDESVHFYNNFLGLEQVDNKPRWRTFKLGDMLLALRPWTPETEDERRVKHGICLAFHVENVDESIEELEKKGARILIDPENADFGRFAKITDPDGYIIMLISKNG